MSADMSANEFLPERYDELVHRLALGIEPRDAARALRLARPIDVVLDGSPTAVANQPGDLSGLDRATLGLPLVSPRSSGRFVVLFRRGISGSIGLRLHDRLRRYVSRRVSYAIPGDPTVTSPRVRRPLLFPGAAYDVSETATGIRGHVTWLASPDETPVRWARITATVDGVVVGRAHGDDRGEFLLLLDPAAGGLEDLRTPLTAVVTVFAPHSPPDDADADAATRDPLWDLPVERLTSLVDPDDVSTAERLPDGYEPFSTREITFQPGLLRSEATKFVMTP